MPERKFGNIIKSILSLPFSAVEVRFPEKNNFDYETTERSRNLNKAKAGEDILKIPTGATVEILTPDEEISIKDWRERPGHEQGASIKMKDKVISLDKDYKRTVTPGGVEIIYKDR